MEDYLLNIQLENPEKFNEFIENAFKVRKAAYQLAGGVGKTCNGTSKKFEVELSYEHPAKGIPLSKLLLLGGILIGGLFLLSYNEYTHSFNKPLENKKPNLPTPETSQINGNNISNISTTAFDYGEKEEKLRNILNVSLLKKGIEKKPIRERIEIEEEFCRLYRLLEGFLSRGSFVFKRSRST